MKNIRRITPIFLEWNGWNGIIFQFFHIDAYDIDAALFGFNFGFNKVSGFFHIDIFFKNIVLYEKEKEE